MSIVLRRGPRIDLAVLKVYVRVRQRISRLMTIAALNCDLLRRAYESVVAYHQAAGCRQAELLIADGRTDRRRIRAQLFSLPMKRVVISRRTRKHCNASAVRRGSASP